MPVVEGNKYFNIRQIVFSWQHIRSLQSKNRRLFVGSFLSSAVLVHNRVFIIYSLGAQGIRETLRFTSLS
jgi:hypothetical protein